MDASLAQQLEHDLQLQHDIPVQSFTSEQTKEAFDVARNSIELLSTVLSSSPQQDALEVLSQSWQNESIMCLSIPLLKMFSILSVAYNEPLMRNHLICL